MMKRDHVKDVPTVIFSGPVIEMMRPELRELLKVFPAGEAI